MRSLGLNPPSDTPDVNQLSSSESHSDSVCNELSSPIHHHQCNHDLGAHCFKLEGYSSPCSGLSAIKQNPQVSSIFTPIKFKQGVPVLKQSLMQQWLSAALVMCIAQSSARRLKSQLDNVHRATDLNCLHPPIYLAVQHTDKYLENSKK